MTDNAFAYRNSRESNAALGSLGANHSAVPAGLGSTARSNGATASCRRVGLLQPYDGDEERVGMGTVVVVPVEPVLKQGPSGLLHLTCHQGT